LSVHSPTDDTVDPHPYPADEEGFLLSQTELSHMHDLYSLNFLTLGVEGTSWDFAMMRLNHETSVGTTNMECNESQSTDMDHTNDMKDGDGPHRNGDVPHPDEDGV
jgi:hypothetical protein